MARHLLLAVLFVGSSLLAQAATAPTDTAAPPSGLLAQTITVDGTSHRYVVYVPPGYASNRRWPLIVFLNGAGECGTDGWKQVSVGLAPAITADVAKWPFVVLFPQKPNRDSAWEDHDAVIMAMLKKARADYSIDERRLFLTGLSQGGHGTWALGSRHPDLWAAIAPVCGYGEPKAIAPALAKMPIWCFHGEDDKAVPVQQSKALCVAVEKAGGSAELTLYPKVGHNSWDKAYRDEPLAAWFLAVADDLVQARYLARPEKAERATIEIRCEWSTDAGLHFHGTTTTTLSVAKDLVSWRVTTTYPDGPGPEPRQGELDHRAGRELLLLCLRGLFDGAVFRLPEAIHPAPVSGAVMATNQFAIEVALDGKPGPWRFRRDVPKLAEFDPQFASEVRAIVACAKAIEAQH